MRVSAGRDPATGCYRYVSRSVAGGKRDAQRAAAELSLQVARYKPPTKGTVVDLLEKRRPSPT